MKKERIKKINALYFVFRVLRKCIRGMLYYFQYLGSLIHIWNNRRIIQKKIDETSILNVVFVVQYIPSWNKLEPIYSKMLYDKRFSPHILCVPIDIQNHEFNGRMKNDTYEYFIEQGYEAIDAIKDDGGWYDLQQLSPAYVFHSRPYNHFMPKCYTSRKIVKYALICNVMYGVNISVNEQNVCIDKDYFKDVYYYFSFDENEKEYYRKRYRIGNKCSIQKCEPLGAIGIEQMLCCQKEKDRTKNRKTILWTPRWSTDSYIGGSNFFNYKDILVDFAKRNKEYLFIIRPHPLMFSNFINTGEMSEEDVREFKQYCKEEGNIVLDESKEYIETFLNSDVLITDLSGMIPEFFSTMKPIIYCSSTCEFEYTQYSKEMLSSCYVVENASELLDNLKKLLQNEDGKKVERKSFFERYHSNVENSSDRILNELAQINNKNDKS